MSDRVAVGWEDKTEYRVLPTGSNAAVLPPVLFQARSGSSVLQDYLTPDAARALGHALIDTANEVDREPTPPQRCAHGKTVDEPCGDCLADEGLDHAALAHAEAEQEL